MFPQVYLEDFQEERGLYLLQERRRWTDRGIAVIVTEKRPELAT